jgi:hypothetical protein
VPKSSGKKKLEIAPEELTPFKSLLLLSTAQTLEPQALASKILPEVQDLSAGKWRQSVSDVAGPFDDPNLHTAFFTYVEERPPGWARASNLRDVIHHVVIACRGKDKAKNVVAFFFSDNALRDKAVERVLAKEGELGKLASIPAGRMHAAYVQGQTITLWMSGTHRRDATKVDNKVISGLDLQFALDPLGDQSFYFTAARSRLGGKIDKPVGSSPRRSRLWLGPSRDWNDFSGTTGLLFDALVTAKKPVTNPLPVLASPVLDSGDLDKIDTAYDVALIPPELIDPSAASPETLDQRARLSGLLLEPVDQDGPDFSLTVKAPAGDVLGTLDVAFDISPQGSASWTVENEEPAGTDDELFADAVDAVQNRRTWLKVWYDSGHTLADQAFFMVRFRDQPFTNFAWVNLDGFNVTMEKPSKVDVKSIGKDKEKSLFSWVKRHWAVPASGLPGEHGWLACDDGSMEKADFLHLDTINGMATLSLIHVKGSKSSAATRPISVSDYEIVTSQAVKNLRWIDQAVLAVGLSDQLKGRIKDKVWYNGTPSTAAKFTAAIAALGTNYARNVVILQPRVRRTAVDAARAAPPNGAEHLRLLQLDALLLGARANILGLNANMYVIGEDA